MAGQIRSLFVIQPFTPQSTAVFRIIEAAAAKVGIAAIFRADSMSSVGSALLSIHQAIREASVIIADVTDSNPNVMYEVGVAQAQDKPVIVIAESSRHIPFDLSSIRIIIYDKHNLTECIDRLSEAIELATRNPSAFSVSELAAEQATRHRVFISYSHLDFEYLSRLLVHLKPLERDGLIDLWVDTRMRPGDRWKEEIDAALQRATIAILLVSADFLASEFITKNELPPLLSNAEEQGTRILPLILKPCRFARDKNLRHFQCLNDPKTPLALLSEVEQESLYDSVAWEVERLMQY